MELREVSCSAGCCPTLLYESMFGLAGSCCITSLGQLVGECIGGCFAAVLNALATSNALALAESVGNGNSFLNCAETPEPCPLMLFCGILSECTHNFPRSISPDLEMHGVFLLEDLRDLTVETCCVSALLVDI
ncbi:UNVERIFIED_CONTAM: hypothetical protein Sangu_0277500 [Sesamum angustifolium]|uniref:Uncharacterized protein n=1 Tax=Sesamum angustifolium TaxID=2727405 RepID=A0AAW2QPJ5_9LAMI